MPVKRVIDYNVKIRINAEQSAVETNNMKMSLNPFDEIALEEAVRLKEAGIVSEVIAITVGPKIAQDVMRTALAREADKAVIIETDERLNSLAIAETLHQYIQREPVDLVFMGKQAIDDDCNQVPQMLSALLGWSQATFVSEVNIDTAQKTVEVKREVDGGLETLKVNLPVVLSSDLRLNEPRYISLPNVMKSKQKPLAFLPLTEFNVETKSKVKTLKVSPPEPRKPGVKVSSVDELIDKLKNEAKVL